MEFLVFVFLIIGIWILISPIIALTANSRLNQLQRKLREVEAEIRLLRNGEKSLQTQPPPITEKFDPKTPSVVEEVSLQGSSEIVVPENEVEFPTPALAGDSRVASVVKQEIENVHVPKQLFPPPPKPASVADAQGRMEKVRRESMSEAALSLETRLGTVWTMRIGLVLLTIGTAFFAHLIHDKLPIWFKVVLAYSGAMGLFACGKVFERRMRVFARPVMAGGLALGFFVSYAAHFIPAMACVPLLVSLAWMTGGIASVLYCAERWKSQYAAGLAIFLGHVAAFVAAGHADAYSLTVIPFLCVCAVILHLRHDWPPLSLFAIGSAYLSHFAWAFVNHPPSPPLFSFRLNLAFLSSYYTIFAFSDLIWWKRIGKSDETLRNRLQDSVGRAGGPVNVMAYVALVSLFYHLLQRFLTGIEWFYFTLAGVQGLLALAYRRFGNKDWAFYSALGVILATLGLFSAFGGITLNLLLAVEALVLLIAAHQTRLWIFHLLAQIALGINFVHSWAFEAHHGANWDYSVLIGRLMVVAVYFVKSQLEEIWYGGQSRREWIGGGREGPVSKPLSDVFDQIFTAAAPRLAHLHAIAGAMLLVHVWVEFLGNPQALCATAFCLPALMILVLVRRSIPLIFGLVTLQLGALAQLMFYTSYNSGSMSSANEWWIVTSGLVSLLMLAIGLKHRFLISKIKTGLYLAQVQFWCALVAYGIGLSQFPPASWSSFVFWLLSLISGFVAYVFLVPLRQDGNWKDSVERVAYDSIRGAPCFLTAFLFAGLSEQFMGDTIGSPLLLAGVGALLIAVSAWRRLIAFYFSGFFLFLALFHSFFMDSPVPSAGAENPFATAILISILFCVAWAHDHYLSSQHSQVSSKVEDGLTLGTYLVYGIGLWILTAYLWNVVAFAGSVAVLGFIPVVLLYASDSMKFRHGRWVAAIHLLAIQLIYALHVLPDIGKIEMDTFVPILLVLIQTIAVERMIEWRSRPLLKGNAEGQKLAAIASTPLVAGAMIVGMIAAYQSPAMGNQHNWTTAAWSGLAIFFMGLGFAFNSPIYRRTALVELAFCLARIVLVDTRDLPEIYKTAAYLTLGVCLLGVAWLYARFSREIRQWL